MVKMGTLRDHFIGWWTKREIEPIIYTYNQYIYIYLIYIYIVMIYIYSLYIWLYIIQRTRIYSLQTITNRMGPHHQQLEMGIQAKERQKKQNNFSPFRNISGIIFTTHLAGPCLRLVQVPSLGVASSLGLGTWQLGDLRWFKPTMGVPLDVTNKSGNCDKEKATNSGHH
jgi:hypothetical protein